jgi:DNA-binding transcriptional ArsR family regulator
MQLAGIRKEHVLLTFSALRETLRSIEVLLEPSSHAEQMQWVRAVRRRLRPQLRAELAHFRFLFTPHPELFPTLRTDTCSGDPTAGIKLLRSNRQAYVEAIVRRLSGASLLRKSDLSAMSKRRWYRHVASQRGSTDCKARTMLEEFVASPPRSLGRFCAMLKAVYVELLEPVWDAGASELSRDIKMRQDVLQRHGLVALLRTLSPDLRVRQGVDGTAEIDVGPQQARLEFGKRSRLELSPSLFCWPHLQTHVLQRSSGLHCTIAYPLPPLPARVKKVPERDRLVLSASALANEARLRIIELLRGRDLSTRELSGFLRMEAPLISRHLQTLRRASLVERYRSGYFVMYRLRTGALAAIAHSIGGLAGP